MSYQDLVLCIPSGSENIMKSPTIWRLTTSSGPMRRFSKMPENLFQQKFSILSTKNSYLRFYILSSCLYLVWIRCPLAILLATIKMWKVLSETNFLQRHTDLDIVCWEIIPSLTVLHTHYTTNSTTLIWCTSPKVLKVAQGDFTVTHLKE